jgi:DNA-binding winged helix-turn-helix (wHTH) protein
MKVVQRVTRFAEPKSWDRIEVPRWSGVMDAPASSSRRLRTGLFEIDLASGEVYKEGRKVSLQEQPFRVLAVLLERPGEIVTREELQSRLWPADTYVGFDEGKNTAIRKLRVAFGDSVENPRFFQTIPRRGYRFIAPVHEVVDSLQTENAADSSTSPPQPSSANFKPSIPSESVRS